MSRTLASTLVLVGCIGAASAQPPPDVDQAQARRLAERVAEVQRRRAVQAALAVDLLIGEGWVSEARRQLEWQLTVQIEDIDRACSLTNPQRKKLELAGRGDIKRFFDRYEQVIRKSQVERNEQGLRKISQDITPLEITLQVGLFYEDSLLLKSLRNTLTDEQFAQYEAKSLKGRA